MASMPPDQPLCPSAQPDMEGARIIGLISGSAEEPRVAYLPPGLAVDPGVSRSLLPLAPTQVFRFAATCESGHCMHFAHGRCSLAARVVEQLPEVVDLLPPCQIRAGCRWYSEQGGAACRRCPQVITMVPRREDDLNRVAMPREECDDAPGPAVGK